MIRETRFLISRKPYAVDLTSLRQVEREPGESWGWYWADAVWFRRRSVGYGTDRKVITVACTGTLRASIDDPAPSTTRDFLERFTDGRYGGECDGRWDGERYWGAQEPAVIQKHLGILRPMLANYPAIPPGYDGWWTFQAPR